jgi:hypothetical protein
LTAERWVTVYEEGVEERRRVSVEVAFVEEACLEGACCGSSICRRNVAVEEACLEGACCRSSICRRNVAVEETSLWKGRRCGRGVAVEGASQS